MSLVKKRASFESAFKRRVKSRFLISRHRSDISSTGECEPDPGRSVGTEGLVWKQSWRPHGFPGLLALPSFHYFLSVSLSIVWMELNIRALARRKKSM